MDITKKILFKYTFAVILIILSYTLGQYIELLNNDLIESFPDFTWIINMSTVIFVLMTSLKFIIYDILVSFMSKEMQITSVIILHNLTYWLVVIADAYFMFQSQSDSMRSFLIEFNLFVITPWLMLLSFIPIYFAIQKSKLVLSKSKNKRSR